MSEVGKDPVSPPRLNPSFDPGIRFAWKNTESLELDWILGIKRLAIELYHESVVNRTTCVRNGDEILLDEVDLEPVLQGPILAILHGGTDKLA